MMIRKILPALALSTLCLTGTSFARESALKTIQLPDHGSEKVLVQTFWEGLKKLSPEGLFLERTVAFGDFLISYPFKYTDISPDKKPHLQFPIVHKNGYFDVFGYSDLVKKNGRMFFHTNDYYYPVATLNQVWVLDNKKGLIKSSFFSLKNGRNLLLGFNKRTMEVNKIIDITQSSLELSITESMKENNFNNSYESDTDTSTSFGDGGQYSR